MLSRLCWDREAGFLPGAVPPFGLEHDPRPQLPSAGVLGDVCGLIHLLGDVERVEPCHLPDVPSAAIASDSDNAQSVPVVGAMGWDRSARG